MSPPNQGNLSRISKLVKTDYFTAFTILTVAYLYINHLKNADRPVVTTSNGQVRGVVSFSRDYQKFHAFKGIPYGTAERFEPPEPPEDWEGIWDASYYRSQCISLELFFIGGALFGDEDCLYLNVFAKQPVAQNSNKKLPVMVFFHGGLFHFGSAEDHGELYFMSEGVILVTVTYRLGALGFLSTGDHVVRGNQGLKDQSMALRWIQRNICNFGGDPGQVTIFGESAGGLSVGMHLLSPMSKDLFQKAVIQSGATLSPWGLMKQTQCQAKRFAAKFNCPTDDTHEMVQCLKQIDARTLVYGHIEAIDFFRTKPMIFSPTIETVNDSKAFLTEDPAKLLKTGNFHNKVPLVMGVNAEEGLLYTSCLANNSTALAIMSQFELSLPVTLQYAKDDKVSHKIRDFYFEKMFNNGTREDYLNSLTALFSDRHFYEPLVHTARLYSQHAPLYLYYFNFSSFHSMEHFIADRESAIAEYVHPMFSLFVRHSWRVIQEFLLSMPVLSKGACHGSELPLQFNHPWTPSFYSKLPERDVQMSKDFVRLWASFASSSSDTLLLDKVRWTPVKPGESLRYLHIGKTPAMIDEPFSERVKFWESITKDLSEPEVT